MQSLKSPEAVESLLASMQILDSSLRYYAITLTADENGTGIVGTQTNWVGYADAARTIELRQPSLVNAAKFMSIWQYIGQPYSIVKDDDEWLIFYMLGGHGLVEEGVAQRGIPHTFRADECVPLGGLGFQSVSGLPRTAHNRAPTPRLRMKVFDRDARRCRICGRSPKNYVDVELHTHHIRPWAAGGVTVEENLITLCHTCHKALLPHFDRSLYDYLPSEDNLAFSNSVLRHRTRILEALGKERRKVRRGEQKSPE